MKLNLQNPKQSLKTIKAFLKQPVKRDEMTLFKANLQTLLSKINENESEEHHKIIVRDFLKDSFYKTDYEINTKGRQDYVIHTGKQTTDKVGVILETKKPKNTAEMITANNPNKKALHELVLYFLRERIDENNIDIRHLVVTNIYEWFIFDSSIFNRLFYENKAFVKEYKDWRDKLKITSNTPLFYNDIVKPYIEKIDEIIPCTYFDIRDYETALKNDDLQDDKSLIELFKILSPPHLLKVPFADDSNKLDKNFYTELLHIIGLEEIKDKSKLKIDRKAEGKRDSGSLIENAIAIIETKDCLHKVKNLESYGATREDRLFGVALELCLTWINRVLFLKLLEAQLVDYHNGNRDFRFLDINTINDFDELFTLFHQVLAKLPEDRRENIKAKYDRVPYLNSSLFEISELESDTITIESLKDTVELSFVNSSILKDGKNKQDGLPTLEYLFKFLDAYDFASEGREGIAENNRALINASVLGKVFEKINGYKDGSIYTPGFITMYMCRQAIRLAVVQKFKDKYEIDIDKFEDLENYVGRFYKTENILEFNALVNSLHLCDPAVGSGHFLVSSLNEIIAIKSELKILADEKGKTFPAVIITVENDELIVFDEERNEFFKYRMTDGKPANTEAQRLQKTLFHEKQTLIENCLFGVDINPNSVKICRLRLWIELLKNAYYKETPMQKSARSKDADDGAGIRPYSVRASAHRVSAFSELETLPNIDINIKEGNSLVSRFALDEDLSAVLSRVEYTIEDYRNFVLGYKETRNREVKRDFENKIKQIKDEFRVELNHFSPVRIKLAKLENELFEQQSKSFLFGEDEDKKVKRSKKIEELKFDVDEQKQKVKETEENAIYKNAFEWRFEFPEVLDDDGNFTGFDIVIGNPPYIEARSSVIDEKLKDEILKSISNRREAKDSKLITRGSDILIYFFEIGLCILKDNGYFSFVTQNAWLDTDYGFKFQSFLRNNTQILGVYDNETKYFEESANINTIITLFKGNKGVDENEISFAKFNVGFEKAPYELKEIANSKDAGQINTFTQNSKMLNQMKWGIVLNSDDLVIDLHKRLLEKESKTQPKFRIGQGLNLTKDFVVSQEIADEIGISKAHLIPFFTSDDGALFDIDNTKNFLIETKGLSEKEREILKSEGINSIELNKSAREIPSLVLPRGVGRFFCASNSCNAFSSSFVEIYLQEQENYSENLHYLWTFLNSSVGWLIREISGRKNLGGGMLKAEATDLKNYPIYFDLKESLSEIKSLHRKLSGRQAENILSELETQEHFDIDSIIFNKLKYKDDERKQLKEKLIELVSFRINKSKS